MNIWNVLGIEATKDKAVIQNAYREHLMRVNPEDDPEGFLVLRKAYEDALLYADKKEEEGSTWDDTPVGRFMAKTEEIYLSFSKRIDKAVWEEHLKEDVVLGLDTKETVCEELLVFLMSHHLLPHVIWQLLEETFSLEENKEELKEKFPRDFLDYVLNNARYDDSISYYEFEEKEDGLAYDDYISCYLHINGLLQRHETQKAAPLFDQLRDMGLNHPQGKVIYVRYLLQCDEVDVAEFEAQEICEEYEDKAYVQMMMAEVAWRRENYEESAMWYERILEKQPDYYGARCGLAECMMQREEYAQAKKIFRELLNINRFDDYVHKCMLDCNEKLTEQYAEKVAKDPTDYESTVELVWCHYQNFDFDSAKEVLDQMPLPTNWYIMDYYYLVGRVALQQEEKEASLEAFINWLKEYKIHKNDDGDEECMKRNHDRLGLTNFFIAEVYSDLGDEKSDPLMYEKALEYNESAIQNCTIDMGMFLTQHAHLCNKLGRFEETIEYGEKAVVEEQNNFEAYLAMGEAYGEMEQYREALDMYQSAAAYCPYYAKPYIEQIKIYLQFDAIDRAEEVLNAFLDTQAPSLWIKVYQSKIARAKEDFATAKQLIDEVVAGLDDPEAPQDVAEKDTVFHEKALVYYYMDDLNTAIEAVDKAIELNPKCTRYHYFKGNILWDQRKHKDSEACFERALELDPDNANIYLQLGSVQMDAKEPDAAYRSFTKVLELEPNHPQVHGKLGQHFENMGDVEQSITEYTLQLELDPSSYYYISRGLMYMQCGKFELAEEDFLSAKEMDDHNGYAYYNRARVFMARGQYKEAEELLKTSIEVSGDSPAFIFYRYLARCYSRRNLVKKAIETLQEALDKNLTDPSYIYQYMADIYATHGQHSEAMRCYREVHKLRQYFPVLHKMVEVQIIAGDRDPNEIEDEVEKLHERFPENEEILRALAMILTHNRKKARALKILGSIADNHLSATDRTQLAMLAKLNHSPVFSEQLKRLEKEMKADLNDHQGRKHTFFQLGRIALLRGQLEEAKKYLQNMKDEPVCDFCNECACYEVNVLEGMIDEVMGQKTEAHEQYETAFDITKNDFDVFSLLGGKK